MADAARPPDPPPHPPAGTGGVPTGYPPVPPYVAPGWTMPPGGPPPPPPEWGQGFPSWNPQRPYAGQVGSGRFRSMGVGELLDAIFSLYRRNFLLIAAISAVVQVPYAVLQFVLFQVAGFASFASGPFGRFTTPRANQQTLTPDQLQTLLDAVGGLLVVSGILLLVGTFVILPLAEAATTRAVSDRYLDREISLGASYGAAIRRLGALIVQSLILLGAAIVLFAGASFILVGLAAGAGQVGAIVGGLIDLGIVGFAIFAYVRTSLAAPAIVLEGVSGWGGLKRSWQLTRGLGWRLLGIRLLLLLITAIISGVFSTLLTLAGAGLDTNGQFIVSEVAGAVVAVFVSPITYIAVTLLYYDTRIRKEGFDIEMLARSL
jgi:hypothetical protein